MTTKYIADILAHDIDINLAFLKRTSRGNGRIIAAQEALLRVEAFTFLIGRLNRSDCEACMDLDEPLNASAWHKDMQAVTGKASFCPFCGRILNIPRETTKERGSKFEICNDQ